MRTIRSEPPRSPWDAVKRWWGPRPAAERPEHLCPHFEAWDDCLQCRELRTKEEA